MKKFTAILFFLLPFCSFSQQAELIWSDEFNSGSLDLTKWSYETGTGVNGDFGTGQLDRATDRPENISFENSVPNADDGCLVITTRKEFYIDRNYTSGRLLSRDKASWGPGHRIAARVWPRDVKYQGQGFAFWLMPDEIPDGQTYIMWPQGGEVDIMEYVGSIPEHNLGSVHYAWFWQNNQYVDWNHGHQGGYYSFETGQVPLTNPSYGGFPPQSDNQNAGSYGFHVYGIDWYEDRMEFFVDGKVYHIHYFADGGFFATDGEDQNQTLDIDGRRVYVSEYSNHFEEWYPFEHKMFAILSAGVGGQNYTYGGPIVAEAVFPSSVFIDWVRVYSLKETTGFRENEMKNNEVFPNPVNDIIYFKNLKHNTEISIFGLTGKKYINKTLNAKSIDVSALPVGIYILELRSENKINKVKIIKQ